MFKIGDELQCTRTLEKLRIVKITSEILTFIKDNGTMWKSHINFIESGLRNGLLIQVASGYKPNVPNECNHDSTKENILTEFELLALEREIFSIEQTIDCAGPGAYLDFEISRLEEIASIIENSLLNMRRLKVVRIF